MIWKRSVQLLGKLHLVFPFGWVKQVVQAVEELLEYPIDILAAFCKYEANASNTKARLKLVNYTESRPSPAKHAQSGHEDSLHAGLSEKVREKVQRESFCRYTYQHGGEASENNPRCFLSHTTYNAREFTKETHMQ